MTKNRRLIVTDWAELPVLLDAVLVARILGYSLEYTRRLLVQGKIPAHKMDRDWRISKDAFRAYIESANNQKEGNT